MIEGESKAPCLASTGSSLVRLCVVAILGCQTSLQHRSHLRQRATATEAAEPSSFRLPAWHYSANLRRVQRRLSGNEPGAVNDTKWPYSARSSTVKLRPVAAGHDRPLWGHPIRTANLCHPPVLGRIPGTSARVPRSPARELVGAPPRTLMYVWVAVLAPPMHWGLRPPVAVSVAEPPTLAPTHHHELLQARFATAPTRFPTTASGSRTRH
jgi:hypothetical protein